MDKESKEFKTAVEPLVQWMKQNGHERLTVVIDAFGTSDYNDETVDYSVHFQ